MNAQPVKVSFQLTRPMRSPEHPIHLDALLAWSAVREAEEAGHPEPLEAQHQLPLQDQDGPGGKVWCASQLMWQPLAPPEQIFMTKRFELDELASRRGKVYQGGPNVMTQGTGPFKSFVLQAPVVWTRQVVAYGIGDLDRIRQLLARVTHLGKLRRIGLGQIGRYEVEHDPAAEIYWPLRVMPRQVEGYEPMIAVTSPPYWELERRQPAWVPMQIPQEVFDVR